MSKRPRDASVSSSLDHTGSWLYPGAERGGGDSSRPPKRRTTACVACRKQKMKCEMADTGPPCARCTRRDISCLSYKSSETLLQDQRQQRLLQQDLHNMHETISRLCQKLEVDPPYPLVNLSENQYLPDNDPSPRNDTERASDNVPRSCESSPPMTPSTIQAPIDTFMSISSLDHSKVGRSSHSCGERQHGPPPAVKDLVSQGLLSIENVEMLVERYFTLLDKSLYGIASKYKDVSAIRLASSTLLAAICTVSALHAPEDQKLYEICNREFQRLVSTSLFEKRDIEYLRALCIGSFWLPDTSRILTSDAVRRVADLRLHGYFYQIVKPNSNVTALAEYTASREEARDRLRLWYITFICDQHFSILHNRDGLLRHDKSVLDLWDLYLASEGGNETDTRLMSQVSILLISTAVRDAVGRDDPGQVHKSLAVQFDHFSRKLDDWYINISSLYDSDPRIGDFPKAGIRMHFLFGKLYVGHHIFRGLKSDPIPVHFLPAAKMAHEAAISIFEMLLNSEKLQESLLGRPHYVFIMISFAGNFLFEICTKYSEQLPIKFEEAFQLIGNVLTVLGKIPLIAQHPISRMATGLRKRLIDCASSLGKYSTVHETLGMSTGSEVVPTNELYQQGSTINDNMSLTVPFFFPTDQMPLDADQFSYPGYGEFNFSDMNLNFLT